MSQNSVAVLLPCGRPFDQNGLCVARDVMSLPTDYQVNLWIGCKQSNVGVGFSPATYVIEPEDIQNACYCANYVYRHTKEDWLITLADDFEIRGNFFGIIDYLKTINPPICALGVTSPNPAHDNQPNYIFYEGATRNGVKDSHPTFNALPWFAANVHWLRQTFKGDLLQDWSVFGDDLLAFQLQYKYKFIVSVWPSRSIFVKPGPSLTCRVPPKEQYMRLVRQIEATAPA